jgi:hypothetical protein
MSDKKYSNIKDNVSVIDREWKKHLEKEMYYASGACKLAFYAAGGALIVHGPSPTAPDPALASVAVPLFGATIVAGGMLMAGIQATIVEVAKDEAARIAGVERKDNHLRQTIKQIFKPF